MAESTRIIVWGGWPWRWRFRYVHRSRYGGFRELLLGPIGIVWNYDPAKAAHEAIHGPIAGMEQPLKDQS